MSEGNAPLRRQNQLLAVAELRWRMFLNSLRTTRGKLEVASRVIVSIGFAGGGVGGAIGVGIGAYYFVAQNKPEYLAILLWPLFFFWQAFPVMATAFTNNPDSSELLRFPLTYRSYFLIRLAYGSFDPSTALGGLWLVGMMVGISVARPPLFPWALVVLLMFAAFNLLLMQTIFAWVERWLAQRRSREIMGVLFVLFMLSIQVVSPYLGRFARAGAHAPFQRAVHLAESVQGILPPGLAADAVAQTMHGDFLVGLSSFLLLSAMAAVIAYLLHVRLRAQFRGENLSEVAAARNVERVQSSRLGWSLPGFSSSVAAVFEKEVRYLSRSAPILLTLIMPIFMLLIFRFRYRPPSATHFSGGFLTRMPNMAFPAAAAYALLVLTNLIYNNFGGDGGGVQFFYASPVRFRQIVLGKNLTHAAILVTNTALAWIAVGYLYGRPAFDITVATIAGLLFAAPINLTVGNLLSIYSPRRVNFAAFGRQRISQMTVLISLGVQFLVVAVGVGAFWLARFYQNFWIAAGLFLALSTMSFGIYAVALHYVDRIALERRETLMAELCRA